MGNLIPFAPTRPWTWLKVTIALHSSNGFEDFSLMMAQAEAQNLALTVLFMPNPRLEDVFFDSAAVNADVRPAPPRHVSNAGYNPVQDDQSDLTRGPLFSSVKLHSHTMSVCVSSA